MAWSAQTRSRGLSSSSDVKHPPSPSGAHQMNHPQNYAESAYFVHQRYQDTALVIFQQQAKKRKDIKKNPSQHSLQPFHVSAENKKPPSQHSLPTFQASAVSPAPHQLSPGKGHSPSKVSGLEPQGNNSATGNSLYPPSSPVGNEPKSPLSNSEFNSSGLGSEDVASGGIAGRISPGEVSLTATNDAVAVAEQSDIITSHPLSNIEPDFYTESVIDSPLQTSSHSDITIPTSENTTSVNSAADSLCQSDTESDSAVKSGDPEIEEDRNNIPEGEVKTDFREDKEKSVSPVPDQKTDLPDPSEEKLKPILPTGDVETDLDTTGDTVKQVELESDIKADNSDVFVEEAVKQPLPVGDAYGDERSSVSDRVSGSISGVEFAHYGSSGVVARRKVAMTKSDRERTQSRVCAVM